MTRVGTLAPRVPRDRDALYQPTVFQRYARHEQARIALLAEYHLQGVSTRKVRQVVETLCGETVSASRVSSAMKRLDVTLAAWRARRLDAQAMPYLIVDAHYARIRREGQVLSTAALWVIGIRTDGYREYLGCWLGNAERTLSWSAVFRDLQARGLHGVQYVVSDEHAGRRAARQRHSPDAVHQRCQVHFLRNAFATVSTPRWQQELLTGLRNVWAAPTLGAARTRATHTRHAARRTQLAAALRTALPEISAWFDATLEETLGVYALAEPEARRRLRTSNALEREHDESRRRTRVIRIFPTVPSFLRLVTALAADRNDAWSQRRYLIPSPPHILLVPPTTPAAVRPTTRATKAIKITTRRRAA